MSFVNPMDLTRPNNYRHLGESATEDVGPTTRFMTHHIVKGSGEDDLLCHIRGQMEEEAKEVGRFDVVNLQQTEVDIHKLGVGTKRAVPIKPMGVGKEIQRLRAELLSADKEAHVGPWASFVDKSLDLVKLEGPLICMRKGMTIKIDEHKLEVVDEVDPEAMVIGQRILNMASQGDAGIDIKTKAQEEEQKSWAEKEKN
ncbi:hypothetical protein V8G54_002108 [Vigna mungo]|uniref:Uncharacterized protein n=1 Tax=Vigna mungo TaxID=3915 RepID=A0AAQ3P915_VIGMU